MSAFTLLLICVQACLVQNVFGACLGTGPASYGFPAGTKFSGPYGVGAPFAIPYGVGIAEPFGYNLIPAPCNPGFSNYGGAGIGNVAVSGELPVEGVTAVAGQVPIIGAVEYAGPVYAAGGVTIAGNCACGFGGPYF